MPKAAGLEDLYIQSDEQMPNVVRTQMDVVLSQGMAVLNAEDEEVVKLAQYCDGEVTYFASSEEHPRIVQHRSENGRVVFWRKNHLVLAQGNHEIEALNRQLPAIDKVFKNKTRFNQDQVSWKYQEFELCGDPIYGADKRASKPL